MLVNVCAANPVLAASSPRELTVTLWKSWHDFASHLVSTDSDKAELVISLYTTVLIRILLGELVGNQNEICEFIRS